MGVQHPPPPPRRHTAGHCLPPFSFVFSVLLLIFIIGNPMSLPCSYMYVTIETCSKIQILKKWLILVLRFSLLWFDFPDVNMSRVAPDVTFVANSGAGFGTPVAVVAPGVAYSDGETMWSILVVVSPEIFLPVRTQHCNSLMINPLVIVAAVSFKVVRGIRLMFSFSLVAI